MVKNELLKSEERSRRLRHLLGGTVMATIGLADLETLQMLHDELDDFVRIKKNLRKTIRIKND
jgi:hypothetical protein